MSYDLINYEDLKEGQDILAFGCPVLSWDFDTMGKPAYGFVPAEDKDELKTENQRLREVLEKIYDIPNMNNIDQAVEIVIEIQNMAQQTLNEVTK